MLELLIASGSIVAAAIMMAAGLPRRGLLAYLLAVALLVEAMIATTVGIAGLVARSLSGVTLLALALVWLVPGVVVVRRAPIPRTPWRERVAGSAATIGRALRDPVILVPVILVAGMLAWRAFLVSRLPVIDYDGWSYHLVFADVWLQHDALVQVTHRPWTAGYPAIAEMVTTWLMAFTRSDSLAGLISLLPIPFAIVATAGLARSFGADRRWALLAGLVMGMTPALVALSGTTYVDAASVATVAATWWLGLRVLRSERHWSTVGLLGIAGGLALGTKGTNILLVAPILGVTGIELLRKAFAVPGVDRRHAVELIVLLTLPVVAFGASWYLKNLAIYENPLYPFAIGPFVGPITVSEFVLPPPPGTGHGLVEQLSASWTADWNIVRYPYNVRPGGLGRAWPLILVVAAIGLLELVRRRQLAAIALVVVPAVATLVTMPMPWYARLTLFVPAVAAALGAVGLGVIAGFRRRMATVAALGIVGVATVSLAFATAVPNVDVAARVHGTVGLSTAREYAAYLLDANDDRRTHVGLREECSGFDAIPPGARVAPGGFNLLHGVVGPGLTRVLTDPVRARNAEALVSAMQRQAATWLVTNVGNQLDRVAASAPGLFVSHGEVCQGGRLWELQQSG